MIVRYEQRFNTKILPVYMRGWARLTPVWFVWLGLWSQGISPSVLRVFCAALRALHPSLRA